MTTAQTQISISDYYKLYLDAYNQGFVIEEFTHRGLAPLETSVTIALAIHDRMTESTPMTPEEWHASWEKRRNPEFLANIQSAAQSGAV